MSHIVGNVPTVVATIDGDHSVRDSEFGGIPNNKSQERNDERKGQFQSLYYI